jgi:septum formation protein
LTQQTLILASASPRRRELLALLGLPFTVTTADVDERPLPGEAPDAMVARLSREKARAAAARYHDGWVIASDTTVVFGGEILGKPQDTADAERMLRQMRGRPHIVYTGLALLDVKSGRETGAVAATTVWMRDYSDQEISAYVASGDPLDKAGAYGIQNTSFHPVERLEGCYTSVMGFPLCHLYRLLAEWGGAPSEMPVRACLSSTGFACRVYEGIISK